MFFTLSIALTRLNRQFNLFSSYTLTYRNTCSRFLTNRSPQKEFPLLAALVGLKTALDCRLWKAFQIRSGSMATRFAWVPLLYLSFTLLASIFWKAFNVSTKSHWFKTHTVCAQVQFGIGNRNQPTQDEVTKKLQWPTFRNAQIALVRC